MVYMANPTNWLLFEVGLLAVVATVSFFVALAANRDNK
jgi:hypothetical protein